MAQDPRALLQKVAPRLYFPGEAEHSHNGLYILYELGPMLI